MLEDAEELFFDGVGFVVDKCGMLFQAFGDDVGFVGQLGSGCCEIPVRMDRETDRGRSVRRVLMTVRQVGGDVREPGLVVRMVTWDRCAT